VARRAPVTLERVERREVDVGLERGVGIVGFVEAHAGARVARLRDATHGAVDLGALEARAFDERLGERAREAGRAALGLRVEILLERGVGGRGRRLRSDGRIARRQKVLGEQLFGEDVMVGDDVDCRWRTKSERGRKTPPTDSSSSLYDWILASTKNS